MGVDQYEYDVESGGLVSAHVISMSRTQRGGDEDTSSSSCFLCDFGTTFRERVCVASEAKLQEEALSSDTIAPMK